LIQGDLSRPRPWGSVASVEPGGEGRGWLRKLTRVRRPRAARPQVQRSAFAGFRFPPEVITVAVRWYLRYGLSYRDVEELLAERGVEVDHVTIYRWVQRFTPGLPQLSLDATSASALVGGVTHQLHPFRHQTRQERRLVGDAYVSGTVSS
jgi:hypothetical protein